MFRGGLPEALDHLVYIAGDLNEASERLGRSLGVTPAPGGKHPRWGTHNALLSLGPRIYLEVLARDPAAAAAAASAAAPARSGGEGSLQVFGFDRPPLPRLATWCARADDLAGRVAAAEEAGIDLGSVLAGGRRLPDGSELHWRSTPPKMLGDGLAPFFIDWEGSPHPAASAPPGCRLVRLEAEHPDPESIWKILKALGVELQVSRGPRARLLATIHGPAGSLTLA